MTTLKKILFTVFILTQLINTKAQTLMTVGNKKIDVKEFSNAYAKNGQLYKDKLYTKENLEEYANLYALYLMKIQEAYNLKLDTQSYLKAELNNYENQLSSKYLNNQSLYDNVVKEAYERMKKVLNVSHIMIRYKGNNKEDTLAILKSLKELSDNINSGKISFEDAAKSLSEDESTKNKGGKIGWVSSMQTPYSFENAIYNSAEKKASEPFKTKYGYHIVYINETKENKGQLKLAQILISSRNEDKPEDKIIAEKKANEVYNKLKGGEDFAKLVGLYSQDKFTLNSEGVMDWIGPGKTTEIFENAAYSLKNIGDITEPIKTQYGYHIIKLLEIKPLPSFAEQEPYLKQSSERDDRGLLAKEEFMKELKKKNNVVENTNLLNQLIQSIDNNELKKGLLISNIKNLNQTVFSIGQKKYKLTEFIDYIKRMSNNNYSGDLTTNVYSYYKMFTDDLTRNEAQTNLKNSNPEFKNLMDDYKNGILIFDLMEKNIWTKSIVDTIGLKNFYSNNNSKYKWNNLVEYDKYVTDKLETANNLLSALNKQSNIPEEVIILVKNIIPNADINFSHHKENKSDLNEGIVNKLNSNLPIFLIADEKSGKYFVYNIVHQTSGTSIKTFEEAKGYVLSDYQNYLESSWYSELRKKYPLAINKNVLDTLIKK